ncbi:MAG: PDZ domain-containing protein, partial [Candidatus Omnitrophica bacterium]|nr:PDZ domain-containing protein [Candidatus Omnitrophota bacterium]
GVVVADQPPGVRVISVERESQAHLSDLRPEDIVIQVDDTPIQTIDEFAVLSHALKGRAVQAAVIILRNGEPKTLTLHLYSFPILQQWGLSFVPEHDIRFAEPRAGVAYWTRLGRGFDVAGNLESSLNAYLNALHHDPIQPDTAITVSELLWRISRRLITAGNIREAIGALNQGTTLLGRLFDYPLTEAQLQSVKRQLEETVRVLRTANEKSLEG